MRRQLCRMGTAKVFVSQAGRQCKAKVAECRDDEAATLCGGIKLGTAMVRDMRLALTASIVKKWKRRTQHDKGNQEQ